MIKVGIVDSGINESALRSRVVHRSCIDKEENYDINGHGTMCAYIIEKYSQQEIVFYSYKIFDKELVATKNSVKKALKYAVMDEVDILNLSLSINSGEDKSIEVLVQGLNEMGTQIIASKSKTGEITLLDTIDNIVIVDGDDNLEEDYVNCSLNRVRCSREAILCKYYKNCYAFFGGNSKATALYTALKLRDEDTYIEETIENPDVSESDMEEMCSYLSRMMNISVKSIMHCDNWEMLGNYFEVELIKCLVKLLGDKYIDSKTIYYRCVNNYRALKELLGGNKDCIK